MKLNTIPVLVVVAGLATVALVGASSASATVLCKENASPCPESKLHPAGTTLEAKLETGQTALLDTDTEDVECKASKFAGKSDQESGAVIGVSLSELEFASCETVAAPAVACSVTPLNGPFDLGIVAIGGGNGAFSLEAPSAVAFEVICGAGARVNCVFTTTPAAEGEITGGKPAKGTISSGALTIKGSVCPKKAAELTTGTYEFTVPTEFYVINEIAPPVLCESNTDPCPAGKTYAIGTAIKAELEAEMKFTFTIGGKTKEPVCKTSKIEGKTTQAGTPLIGEITSLTTKECAAGACTITPLRTAYKFEIEHTGNGDGTMTWRNKMNGQPAFEITCGLETCIYGAATLPFTVTGGAPAKISKTEISLTKEFGSGLFCGASAVWEGAGGAGAIKYKVTSPTSVFVRS